MEKNALLYSETVAKMWRWKQEEPFVSGLPWQGLLVVAIHHFYWLQDPRKITQPLLVCFLVDDTALLISLICSVF